MTINTINISQIIIGIIGIGISIYLGLSVAIKYFEHDIKPLILVAISSFITTEYWWPDFINAILQVSNFELLHPVIENLIRYIGLPFGVFTWCYAVTELMYKKNQKIILINIASFCIICEIVFIILSITDPLFLLDFLNINHLIIIKGLVIILLLMILITGVLFARENLESENIEIKLKGKLLLFAFITYFTVGLLDLLFSNPYLTIILLIWLLPVAIAFYGGLLLPDWMKKLLIRDHK